MPMRFVNNSNKNFKKTIFSPALSLSPARRDADVKRSRKFTWLGEMFGSALSDRLMSHRNRRPNGLSAEPVDKN